MKNRKINKKWFWLVPIMLISCAHTTPKNGYQRMYASLFTDASYKVEEVKAELGDHGYVIEGTLENLPNNLIVLFEYTPENLVFMDSARTDSVGNFRMQKVMGDEKICYLQFGQRLGLPTAVSNKTNMKLKIKTIQGGGVSYLLEGEGITSAKQIKKLTELNSGYLFKLNALQMQVMGYDKAVTSKEQMENARMQMLTLENQRKAAVIKEINAGEPSVAPYFGIKYLLQDADYKVINQGYLKCKKYNEKLAYTQILKAWSELERKTAIGSPAPAINQKTPQGTMLALSALKGKVVLIDFWASWCRPCMSAMPELKQTYAKYKSKGFEIYGVSLDKDSTRWARTIEIQKLAWRQVSDLQYWNNAAAKAYRVNGIPATYLIDKKGNIAGKNLHGLELEMKIEELLAKP